MPKRAAAFVLLVILALMGILASPQALALSVLKEYYVPLPETQLRQSFVTLATGDATTSPTAIMSGGPGTVGVNATTAGLATVSPLNITHSNNTGSKSLSAKQSPAIYLTKTAGQAFFTKAGDVLTYTFTIVNTGDVTLTNIMVTDSKATVSGGPLAALAPGASDTTTFTASYTTTQADMSEGAVTNKATVQGTPPTGPAVTDTASAYVWAAQQPSLSLVKTADQPSYSATGDVLTYKFSVKNTGNMTLANIVVADPKATVYGGPIASLEPGVTDSTTFTASYTVTAPDVLAGSVVNTATVAGVCVCGPFTPEPSTATVPLFVNPSISLVKSAMQTGFTAAGDVLTYALTVTNSGNVTLTNVTVTDPVATVTGAPITLLPGQSDSLNFAATYTVTQADVDAGSFTNTATATGTPPEGPKVTATDGVTVPFTENPSINIVKNTSQTGFSVVGDVLHYTFTVTNTGNVMLTNVTVTDPSAVVSGGPLASLAPGASDSTTFTAGHTVAQTDLDAGRYINTATATGTPPSGPNVTATGDATVPAVQTPAITLAKTAVQANYTAAGNVLNYEFTVTNTGNVTLTGVTVTDPDAVVSGGPIPSLAPGATDSTTFTASHTVTQEEVDAGHFTNTATVTGTPPSGPAVTNTGSATVPAAQTESISIVKTANQANYSFVGDVLTYKFTVTNTGNVTLTNVMVTDPVALVTGNPITLLPGQSDSTSFTANYTVSQADVNADGFTNTATVSGTPPSGPAVGDSDSATVPFLASPSIDLEKAAEQTSFSSAGELLTYTFTVTNTGNVTLTNVMVTDLVALVTGNPITLLPGQSDSTSFTAIYTVSQADVNAGGFTNTATASGTPPSGPAVSDSDSAMVPSVASPSIDLVKTAVQANYGAVGEALGYTFTVTNTGNVTLTNVTVTDPSATVVGGPIASLAPGVADGTTFTASHTVTQADLDAGSFKNTATATGVSPAGPTITDSGTATVPALQRAAVSLVKSGEPRSFHAVGDIVIYTFKVTNTGNVTLYNVTISDTLVPVTGGPIVSLAPGVSDSTTFSARYAVTQADLDAGSILNVATVSADNLVGPAVMATDAATVVRELGEGEGEGEDEGEGEGNPGLVDGCNCPGTDGSAPSAIIMAVLSFLGLLIGYLCFGC